MKYRKKPVVIDAIQFTKNNHAEVCEFCKGVKVEYTYDKFYIPTLEGVMEASLGDYIIRGVQGEYYPCKPDIFEQTYEKAE